MSKAAVLSINDFNNVFFIGVAGTGMSAIAQYLSGIGKIVSGSDRYFKPDEFNDTKSKLETSGVHCFLQDGSGISEITDLIVVSTAIEDSVPEVQKAKSLGIPILKEVKFWPLLLLVKKQLLLVVLQAKAPPVR